MAKVMIEMSVEGIKELVQQLTPQELQAALSSIQGRMETLQMMKLAESAFAEWNTETDLYSDG